MRHTMLMNKKMHIIVLILLAANVVTFVSYVRAKSDARAVRAELAQAEARPAQGAEVKAFLSFFVSSVLQADGEVSIEDRLRLESDIRAIGDAELLSLWTAFVASGTEEEAQRNVEALLAGLAAKI